jgi:hypothetical protein
MRPNPRFCKTEEEQGVLAALFGLRVQNAF